jgi:hypothetical protein
MPFSKHKNMVANIFTQIPEVQSQTAWSVINNGFGVCWCYGLPRLKSTILIYLPVNATTGFSKPQARLPVKVNRR